MRSRRVYWWTYDGNPGGFDNLRKLQCYVSEHVVVGRIFRLRCVQVESSAFAGSKWYENVVTSADLTDYRCQNPNYHPHPQLRLHEEMCRGKGGRCLVVPRLLGSLLFVR